MPGPWPCTAAGAERASDLSEHHDALIYASPWYGAPMRTTLALDDDVVAAVEQLRRERGLGLSEAVNELARRGLAERAADQSRVYRHRTAPLGIRVDVTDVAEVLDLLDDEPGHRAS